MTLFQSATWATLSESGILSPIIGKQSIQMAKSDATALPLLLDTSSEKPFGAGLIRFAPNEKVGMHIHPGAHILFVTSGTGFLTYESEKIELVAGMLYLIPENVPHAIDATTELVLIVVGNDYRHEGSEARLKLTGD